MKTKEEIKKTADNHARRVVALEWCGSECEQSISGAWEAGYIFGCIDSKSTPEQQAPPDKGGDADFLFTQFPGKGNADFGKQDDTEEIKRIISTPIKPPIENKEVEQVGESDRIELAAKEHYPDHTNPDDYNYPNSAVKLLQRRAFYTGANWQSQKQGERK